MRTGRGGFTLLELLVVIAGLAPLVAAALGLVLHATRSAVSAVALAAAEASVSDAVHVLEAELAPLVPGRDLLSLSSTTIRFRAVRGTGAWCRLDSLGVVVPSPGAWAASRGPQAGRDSIEVELVASAGAPARWRWRGALQADPQPSGCAPPGGAGLLLTTPLVLPPGVALGPLLRTDEVVEFRAYQSGGRTWLGMDHPGTGAGIEPLAGPFTAGGIRFEGLRGDGTPATGLPDVRAIGVLLVTEGRVPVRRDLVLLLRG